MKNDRLQREAQSASECCQAEGGCVAQAANVIGDLVKQNARLTDALKAIRLDIYHPRNREAIVCTLWHSDIETIVDFICNTLDDDFEPEGID